MYLNVITETAVIMEQLLAIIIKVSSGVQHNKTHSGDNLKKTHFQQNKRSSRHACTVTEKLLKFLVILGKILKCFPLIPVLTTDMATPVGDETAGGPQPCHCHHSVSTHGSQDIIHTSFYWHQCGALELFSPLKHFQLKDSFCLQMCRNAAVHLPLV